MDVASAYQTCERITRSRAANFFYGIRLLPPHKRRALCAVYAFARRVDDVGDGPGAPDEKLRRLGGARAAVAALAVGPRLGDPDPVLVALADARARFHLPIDALEDLIDGVQMDLRATRYEAFDELAVYCRRVAGSIGRLSVAAFGSTAPERAAGLADDLGVAMQLTNILRDVREDLSMGRQYLPKDDLDRFGCLPDPLDAPPGAVAQLIRFEVERAHTWFAQGLRLLPLLDARSASCVSAMTGIYRRILGRIERRPQEVLLHRVALPPWEKAWVAARSVAGVGA